MVVHGRRPSPQLLLQRFLDHLVKHSGTEST